MSSNYSAPAPKQRSRFSGCLLWLILAAIVAVGVYFGLTYKPSGRAEDLAPAISSFTGEPDLLITQTGEERTPYGEIKQYAAKLANGDQVYFDINKKGDVSGFYRTNQSNGQISISFEQARETAIDFAMTHYPNLSWLDTVQLVEQLTGTTSSSNRFYTFEWIYQDTKSGAYLPQRVKVEVNAQTGKVDRSMMLNEPVTISTTPAIDQTTAINTALSAIPDTPDFRVNEVLLTVVTLPLYETDGKQALVWIITATAEPDETGYVAGAVIFIDAQTGQILFIDQFA